jgi:hypothetical protein
LNSGIVASTAAHITGVVVVVVISMVVLVLAVVVVVVVISVVVLVLAVVVVIIVVVVVVIVVVVVGPLGQNWCPNRRSRSHTNGIFWLQRKSFHAAGIVASL